MTTLSASASATLASMREMTVTLDRQQAEIEKLRLMVGEMAASIRYVGDLPEDPADLDPEWYAHFREISARGFVRDAS